jgi:hypothetical protein
MNESPSACAARPATYDDLGEVAGVLHRVFGSRPSVAALRWKYKGCAGRLVGSTVLTSQRRIVGFLGQVPVRVRVNGREVLAAQGADLGILEEHRRLDAFLTLVQASVRELETAGVSLTYGTPNTDAAFTLAALLGQRPLAPFPLLVRPLGGTLLFRILSVLAWATTWVTGCASASLGAEQRLIRLDRFDDRFDRLWNRIRDDYPIMIARDAAYLNWRYANTAGQAYERMVIKHVATGEVEGYAVLGLTRWHGRLRGRICELVTPRGTDLRIAHALVGASIEWFRERAADVADVWMVPHAHLRLALRWHGFIPRPAGPGGFQACVLTPGAKAELQGLECAGNWFLSLGNGDTV